MYGVDVPARRAMYGDSVEEARVGSGGKGALDVLELETLGDAPWLYVGPGVLLLIVLDRDTDGAR